MNTTKDPEGRAGREGAADEVLRAVDTLPPLRATLARLLDELWAEEPDLRRIAGATRPDALLTVMSLHRANAAIHAASQPVTDVETAVTRLGVLGMREVALAAAFAAVVPDELGAYGLTRDRFWAHCAATGVLAAQLCRRTSPDLQMAAFAAGVLHDLGEVVTSPSLGDALFVAGDPSESTDQLEERLLGLNHADAGSRLLARWGMPDLLVAAVRAHHDPSLVTGPARILADAVHVADVIAYGAGWGVDVRGLSRTAREDSAARLALKPQDIERVLAEAWREIGRLEGIFPPSPEAACKS